MAGNESLTPLLPRHILVQLYTRFLLNLPNELKEECNRNFVRLFFELERAHWFYLDHFIEDPAVGGVDMFGLAEQLFKEFPDIVPVGVNWQEKYKEWRKYRGETETGGAIILDEYFEMVLLVQGFYGNRWSFPGGKVNENESLIECASREVLEETGLDIEYRIVPSLYIDRTVSGTLRRAFIIENMPRISRLQPGTRNEIEAITWFNVQDLPTHTQDSRPIEKLNMRPNSFYLVVPFVRQLQEYIRLRRTGLSALSALEESNRLADVSRATLVPLPLVEPQPLKSVPKRLRSTSGRTRPSCSPTRPQIIGVKQQATQKQQQRPSRTQRKELPKEIDLNEFRTFPINLTSELLYLQNPTTRRWMFGKWFELAFSLLAFEKTAHSEVFSVKDIETKSFRVRNTNTSFSPD
ncbi:hypothetical protein CRM22_004019 [Opisthorchis felineus]|uniref:mRNA-decapping enzyme 2 n=1 Tax=Opisthorchis felineus TaxID=147828 RepID=A0A4S2LYG7_OPIFE|nr:hypothetical protein CRM22_004019 [Opisthorchis felineus]